MPTGDAGSDRKTCLETYELPHPDLPTALDGLTVLHISDTHARRSRAGEIGERLLGNTLRGLPEVIAPLRPDLICLTGDYMDHPGDEDAAMASLGALADAWAPTTGVFGVFGNHDTPVFQDRVRREIRGIRWLENDAADVETHGVTLRILGASEPEDLLHAVLSADASTVPAFTLALAHFPPQIYPAAQLGIPLVLAGHTHGGQIRLGPSHAPHTSCDLDKNLASGVIRLGETLCAISRGVGETMLDLRVNCPPQLSLYTLRRGELPGGPDREADAGTTPRVRQVIAW